MKIQDSHISGNGSSRGEAVFSQGHASGLGDSLPDRSSVVGQRNFSHSALDAVLDRVYKVLPLNDNRPYVRYDQRGYPYLRPNAEITIRTYTDCHDTETAARNHARYDGQSPKGRKGQIHDPEPVQNYSTLHLAVIIAGYLGSRAEIPTENHKPVLLLGNAAPRAGSNPHSIGNKFVFAELPCNVFYGGTIEGLSLVKSYIKNDKIYEWNIEVEKASTVFRSRFLQETGIAWCNREKGVFRGEISTSKIPEITNREVVFSEDNFGNIKTGLTADCELIRNLKIGQTVQITINGITHPVRIGRGVGDVEEGGLVLAPGSTSHVLGDPLHNLWDIYQNNGDAVSCYTKDGKIPKIGSSIAIDSACHDFDRGRALVGSHSANGSGLH